MSLDEKTVDYAIRIFETVGFPSAVAGWLMWKTDAKIEKLTDAVNDLKSYIQEHHQ